MSSRKRTTVGSSFEAFLKPQGQIENVTPVEIKRVIADQVANAMRDLGLTKTAMAERMGTTRQQLDRLLDPANGSMTLQTLLRAASAVGKRLRVELE